MTAGWRMGNIRRGLTPRESATQESAFGWFDGGHEALLCDAFNAEFSAK
jgi:hypothetical protein